MVAKCNLKNASMMVGAASSIILPQAVVNTWPSLFVRLAPLTSNTHCLLARAAVELAVAAA